MGTFHPRRPRTSSSTPPSTWRVSSLGRKIVIEFQRVLNSFLTQVALMWILSDLALVA